MSLSEPSVCALPLATYLMDFSLSRSLSMAPLGTAGESKFKSISPFNSPTPANKWAAKCACAVRLSSRPLSVLWPIVCVCVCGQICARQNAKQTNEKTGRVSCNHNVSNNARIISSSKSLLIDKIKMHRLFQLHWPDNVYTSYRSEYMKKQQIRVILSSRWHRSFNNNAADF